MMREFCEHKRLNNVQFIDCGTEEILTAEPLL